MTAAQMTSYQELQRRQEAKRVSEESAERAMDEVRTLLERPTDSLDLSVRAKNCIDAQSMIVIGDICSRDEEELLGMRNFGKTSLREIKKKLGDMGLTLGMDLSQYMAGKS